MEEDKSVQKVVKPKADNSTSTVEVPIDQWNEVLKVVDLFNKQNQSSRPLSLKDRVKERTVRLRVIEEKYVVGLKKDKFGRVIMEKSKNEMGDNDFIVTVILSDGNGKTSEKKVFYLMDLLRESMSVTVPIKKIIDNSIIKDSGLTTKKEVKEGGWDTYDTGIEVALEDIVQNLAYVVELPEGSEVEVEEQFVNM